MSTNNTDGTPSNTTAIGSTAPDIACPAKHKRSEQYWFEDGTIVLLVDGLLFRVHRGILSHHSSVFRDMFSIPQPAVSGEDFIDGCRVVELPGDEADDWGTLLRVIYDHDTTYKEEGPLESKASLSMLRLGRKYQFDTFFDAAMKRITPCFPSTIDTWRIMTEDLNGYDAVLIEVLCLMVEFGNLTLLPSLYFYCATAFGLEKIFQKCITEARNKTVSSAVFQNIILGREGIGEFYRQQQLTWASMYSNPEHRNNCSNKTSLVCHKATLEMNDLQPSEYMFLLAEDGDELMDTFHDSKLCEGCQKAIITAHDESRATFWAKLPSYFGLPAWEDLKDL